jgi:hypothetical protein
LGNLVWSQVGRARTYLVRWRHLPWAAAESAAISTTAVGSTRVTLLGAPPVPQAAGTGLVGPRMLAVGRGK